MHFPRTKVCFLKMRIITVYYFSRLLFLCNTNNDTNSR